MTELTRREAEFLLYQTEDGETRVEVRFDGETTWLSLGQMAELFQRDKSVISRHIKNVFEEGELDRTAVVAGSAITAADGKTHQVEYFNLDVIISVGYRVKSHRGTQFRIWATQRLREYIIKGFTLDDDRLKRAGGGNYFDELLARIRDVRSSEKVFWRKVLDIYATSIDYDPRIEASQRFSRRSRTRCTGRRTATPPPRSSPLRADATRPHGPHQLDRRGAAQGGRGGGEELPRRADEIEALNRIVTAYLELAELQALNRKPMYMADWIAKLDDFLQLSEREILRHAGRLSHEEAAAQAELEYDRFAGERAALPAPGEKHFEAAVRDVKQLEATRRASKARKPPASTRKKP
ncbi:MAG TPA: RhuM family protein [Kofleriaceae bacterium]|jgi:hypothetical protein|nr:RhuM family protein [Kofleriaceae bacterium]